MLEIKSLPACDAARNVQRSAKEQFAVCDLPGFAAFCDKLTEDQRKRQGVRDWYGGMDFNESLSAVRDGDMSGVPASDRLLSEMESLVPVSQSWRIISDVVGGVPDVPAYLAGVPMNMRRRQRVVRESAPLAVFVELVASAGINAETCRKRGAALLALVRALTNLRPVELWACIAIGQSGQRNSALIRLDTAPLDLARAAHVLTHASVFRALGYESIKHNLMDGRWTGAWAFSDHGLHVRTAAESYRRVLNPGSDVLFIPPVHLKDKYLTEPATWMREMLATHGGVDIEAA